MDVIKNKYLVILLVFFLSCESRNEYTIKYISSNSISKTNIGVEAVFFETYFTNDFIVIKTKEKKLFEEYITTDNKIGLAKLFHFDNKSIEHLSISINKNKFNLKNITGKYAFIKLYNDTIFINYKDKVYGYK